MSELGLYLSPIWHTLLPQYRAEFGYMQNLHNGGVGRAIEQGYIWMLDNGVYSNMFTVDSWLAEMERYRQYQANCLGCVVPDAVGDSILTLKRWKQYASLPRQLGYNLCFVSQDGMTHDDIPWDDLDVLFVGGTDHHKLGGEAEVLCREALEREKWLHIGRVNSAKRLLRFWYANSYDGTTLSIEPSSQNQRRILFASKEATILKAQRRLL